MVKCLLLTYSHYSIYNYISLVAFYKRKYIKMYAYTSINLIYSVIKQTIILNWIWIKI